MCFACSLLLYELCQHSCATTELNQLTGIAAILTFPLDIEVVEAEEREAKEEEERRKAEEEDTPATA